ncbi:MAG: oligosaccharide flippase family protein, partial [Planctomycetes bacterium]|nr:oligosaccharide flippase family protein [Planctomycetota bacterium]
MTPGPSAPPPPGGDPAAPDDVKALRRRALGGSVWTIAGYAAQNVLRLGGNIILARLLFPEAFGLMAIVHVFIQGLWLFTDVGVGPAIVQSDRGDDPRYLNTAWTFQLVRGVVLCLASFLLAWPVAALYSQGEPLAADLLWYLPATGLAAVMDGSVSTRVHVHGRHLRVRQLMAFELAAQAGSLLVMVGFAWVYPSVWALVAGTLAKSAIRLTLSHTALEGAPNRPGWDPAAARALFQFGKWVFVSTMLTFLATQADRLIFGGLVPWSLLGVYGIAAALAAMPVGALLQVGTKVVFPTLSRLRGREAALLREARRVRLPLLLGGGALVSAMLPAGPALIDVLYDARYAEAGWILQLLLLGAWFQVLEAPNTALLLARGETRAVAAGNLSKLVGILALLPLGFWLAGFPGALVGLALADAAKYATTAALVRLRGVHFLRLDAGATALLLVACALGLGAEALAGGPTVAG